LIRRFRELGWGGPYPSGKHMEMRYPDRRRVSIPNPHGSDIDWSLTKRILEQAGIDPESWEKVKR